MKQNHQNSDTVILTDIYLISFLRCKGLPIIEIDRSNQSRVRFHLPVTAEELILQYYNDATIEAVQFASKVEELKDLIFSVSRSRSVK